MARLIVTLSLFPSIRIRHFGRRKIDNINEYQSMIGSLKYAVIGARPDLAYTATVLSQFAFSPNQIHLQAAKCTLRYLKYATVALPTVAALTIDDPTPAISYYPEVPQLANDDIPHRRLLTILTLEYIARPRLSLTGAASPGFLSAATKRSITSSTWTSSHVYRERCAQSRPCRQPQRQQTADLPRSSTPVSSDRRERARTAICN